MPSFPYRLQDNISTAAYRMLIDTVRESLPRTMHKYVNLRQKVMGLEEPLTFPNLYNAMMKGVEPDYSYADAQVIIADLDVDLGRQVREHIHRIFERWSRREPVDALSERSGLSDLARGMAEQLDDHSGRAGPDRLDDEALTDLYATLGCARGLVRAVVATQDAVREIDWDQWEEARF